MDSQTTRFLVQHCLQGGGSAAVIREISAKTFSDVAFAVMTNNGAYSTNEVTGLMLEAYQPDFEEWMVARTMEDLMASRKLRVVAPQVLATAVPSLIQPAQQLPPPLLPAVSSPVAPHAQPFPQPVAPPPQPVSQQVEASTTTSITIEIKDILLAIGSLPRTTEPSCSSVLEHLARQRLPSLGAMVEAGLRECGHQPVWEQVPQPSSVEPVAKAPHVKLNRGDSSTKRPREDQQRHPMDDEHELERRRKREDERTPLKSNQCERCLRILAPGEQFRDHNKVCDRKKVSDSVISSKPKGRPCNRCGKVLAASESFKQHNEVCTRKPSPVRPRERSREPERPRNAGGAWRPTCGKCRRQLGSHETFKEHNERCGR